jgi:hypothetical protein
VNAIPRQMLDVEDVVIGSPDVRNDITVPGIKISILRLAQGPCFRVRASRRRRSLAKGMDVGGNIRQNIREQILPTSAIKRTPVSRRSGV